jgi:hypothetical protein
MNALTDWFVAGAGRGATALLVWSWRALALLALAWLALKICRIKTPALSPKMRSISRIVSSYSGANKLTTARDR